MGHPQMFFSSSFFLCFLHLFGFGVLFVFVFVFFLCLNYPSVADPAGSG